MNGYIHILHNGQGRRRRYMYMVHECHKCRQDGNSAKSTMTRRCYSPSSWTEWIKYEWRSFVHLMCVHLFWYTTISRKGTLRSFGDIMYQYNETKLHDCCTWMRSRGWQWRCRGMDGWDGGRGGDQIDCVWRQIFVLFSANTIYTYMGPLVARVLLGSSFGLRVVLLLSNNAHQERSPLAHI